ncbi:MAG TPA: glycosyltransferase family 2 protein [Candidatus Bacteroides merdigallinarum]|uniref:Glycosyltransferase family 2 protein n=1 Tax=Candidatus Bacteroides merdigallinarum TaxID=2838473 RepID=A0A9D2EAK5_9BACE|nr:glycosyltransferase family 2 protein [Candidatus Bacteroides merdigallinarum]
MNPLVSVIIPAYNAENTIIDCLESVRQQTYKNLEVIVVNDGSKDDTLAVVKQYAIKYNELDLTVYSIANAGPASARNFAIDHAKGEYIAFLDSDDRWISTKLERQMECFRNHPKIKLLGCNYSIGSAKINSSNNGLRMIPKDLLLYKNYFITPTVVAEKTVLNEHKFTEGRKYSEDYNLWLQIAFTNHSCALLRDPLVILYDKPTFGASGLSAKLWSMEKGELRNYATLYSKNLIPLWKYLVASAFSFSKYIRRLIITAMKKCENR